MEYYTQLALTFCVFSWGIVGLAITAALVKDTFFEKDDDSEETVK